jgi:hypothetical protein
MIQILSIPDPPGGAFMQLRACLPGNSRITVKRSCPSFTVLSLGC